MQILLDIDGVMVPASNWKVPSVLSDGLPGFSAKATNSLNRIIQNTGATILLTTSHKSLFNIDTWKEIFATRGIQATISKLPDAAKTARRIDEILNWFHTHSTEKNFVIIDEDKSLNALPLVLKSKLALTHPLVGLTSELADRAIEILRTSMPAV